MLRAALLAASLPVFPSSRLPAQQAYFQQAVDYRIIAALDEPSGVLGAAGRLIYRNNSRDSLSEIYFHLYLNAFRPGSLWSRDEQREGIDRFAHLPEPYTSFERLGRVTIDGTEVQPTWPNAPDSTVVRFALPRRLRPGDSLVVALEWQARPSVVPRRQGRQGRRFDFAQWYPKVAVYDRGGWQAHPLRLAGELYGEFGRYDVTLDLPDDQVVAATGLPIAGDPGWERARANPAEPVDYQRDYYPAWRGRDASQGLGAADPGRKRVRFYAENIHHFAFSLNPQYRYEEGRYGNVVLRTLYLPQDSATWGGGRVIERTGRAMAWLDTIFGTYAYPQTVVLHRIEGGGTEFPMLVMNGGPEESLIFHEVGHIYTYGILGNNEWKDGWLDEGFTTFQTAWNFQRRGMGVPSTQTQQLILGSYDLDQWSQPVGTAAENFDEFGVYNRMVYTKGQLFYEMLRYQMGEEAFRRGLRTYYDRWKLHHVDEDALRDVMEDASGQNLGAFFIEWLHETPLVDYSVGHVDRFHLENGSWRTRVQVVRHGDAVMPVEVTVRDGDSSYTTRVEGQRPRETVEINSPGKPSGIELDVARQTMDWNYLNNSEPPFVLLEGLGLGGQSEHRLGWSSSAPARRDRLVHNWMPLAWYSTAGGVTVGVQDRTNYLGRYAQNALQVAYATRESFSDAINLYFALRNPVWGRGARTRWGAEIWGLDGRVGFTGYINQDQSRHQSLGPRLMTGFSGTYMKVVDSTYVNPALWDKIFTFELNGFGSARWRGDGTSSMLRASGGLGIGGVPKKYGSGRTGAYARGAVEAVHRHSVGPFELGGRLYGGFAYGFSKPKAQSSSGPTTVGDFGIPRQRMLYLAGADPMETFDNPFLRSEGALLVRPDVNYSAPGGPGLRGFSPLLNAEFAFATNVELAVPVVRNARRRIFNSLSFAAFADAAFFGAVDTAQNRRLPERTLADAGVGIRAAHRIGPTRFTTRVDFPLYVNVPTAAVSPEAGDGRTKFRFVWSLEEAF